MRERINPAWVSEMRAAINAAKHPFNTIPFEPVILSWNKAAQWLIEAITKAGMIAQVKQLGAGVKRISIKGTCCPLCGKEN